MQPKNYCFYYIVNKNLLLIKKKLIGIIFILAFSIMAVGQQTVEKNNKLGFDSLEVASQLPIEKSNTFWFDFGVGGFKCKDDYGPSFMVLEFSYAVKKNLFSFKIGGNLDISKLEFKLFGESQPPDHFYDAGLLYGKVLSQERMQFSFSGGIGILGGDMRGKYLPDGSWIFYDGGYKTKKFVTLSIPLEVQFNYIAFPHFGFGLNFFANINSQFVLGGILIKYRWGKLN